MNYWKKRITIFLCMVMAITTVVAYMPATQAIVEAKTNYTYGLHGQWGFEMSSSKPKISDFTSMVNVEKGNKELIVSDLLYGSRYAEEMEIISGDKLKGAKYESLNPKIVSIDAKTGKINAKKTGKALIKITWHKATCYGVIKVVKKSEMKTYKKENADLIKSAKRLVELYKGEQTLDNLIELAKLYREMESGYTYDKGIGRNSANDKDGKSIYNYMIYSQDAFKMYQMLDGGPSNDNFVLMDLFGDINPFSTYSKQCFKIAALSNEGKTITLTLSKKVTDKQYAGAYYNTAYLSKWYKDYIPGDECLIFPMYYREEHGGYDFTKGTATLKKGSDKITIEIEEELEEGTRYELYTGWESNDWIHKGVYQFTAK